MCAVREGARNAVSAVSAFHEYVDEERSQVSVVQVHPDAASMAYHMRAVADHARQAYAQTL